MVKQYKKTKTENNKSLFINNTIIFVLNKIITKKNRQLYNYILKKFHCWKSNYKNNLKFALSQYIISLSYNVASFYFGQCLD